MKAYKIRSLIYLSGFVAAAIYYYNFEQKEQLKESFNMANLAELNATDSEASQNNLLEEQKNLEEFEVK